MVRKRARKNTEGQGCKNEGSGEGGHGGLVLAMLPVGIKGAKSYFDYTRVAVSQMCAVGKTY